MTDNIKAVIFDADDTLWLNEPLFRGAEQECFAVLSEYGSAQWLNEELYKTEMENMEENALKKQNISYPLSLHVQAALL